jgi:adenylate cyclase
MEVAAARGVELALSAALVSAAGQAAAPLQAGGLKGPVSAAIRGRAESIDVWLWQGHLL